MLNPTYNRQFEKDLKRMIKRGKATQKIRQDWLLFYKATAEEIIFERTGTHSDLFE